MKKWIFVLTLLFVSLGLAKAPEGMKLNKNSSSLNNGAYTYSNISNWSYYIPYNYQNTASDPYHHGGTYPQGTAKAIYWDGFIWGGIVDYRGYDRINVGGKIYTFGLVPGWVETWGDYGEATIADPTDPAVRVYRIRSDHESLSHASLINEAADHYQVDPSSVTEAMTQEILDQYQLDWDEWPGERGAPFYDRDKDGIYTSYYDEPGIANADQVTWFVMNDYSRTATGSFMECDPIGLEYQLTSWAYDNAGNRLGQVIFWSHKLINTSNDTVTDMYIGQWCDPDIGKRVNDLIGCDTVLDMGFAYNGEATDEDYDPFNMAPPAVGYDMLQGAIVECPGDTAYINLKPKPGFKSLGMTSFVPAIIATQSGPIVIPENYTNLKYYNLLRGYRGNDNIDNPTPWYVNCDVSNPPTKFPLSGDPASPGSIDVDGTQYWSWLGDRRFLMSTGPFDFAPGDTQEVVLALIGGIGVDCIGSVADMKITSDIIQDLYEQQIKTIPEAPVDPLLNCVAFEKSLVLEWGSDHERVEEIEEFMVSGYEFEGYNVYQVPDARASKDESVRIATFDVVNGIKVINDTRYLDEFENEAAEVPVAYGDDTGIQRYINIDWDYINDKPLYEGKTYYYAVTAYNQNISDERLGAKMYESRFIPIAVILQEELPGNKLQSYVGQSDIPVEHIAGNGEGIVLIEVVDPYAIEGIDYKIKFEHNADSSEVLFSVWEVRKDAQDYKLSSGNALVRDTLVYSGAPIVDGMEIMVMSPPHGIAEVVQPDAHGSSTIVDGSVWHSLQAAGDGSQPWHRAAGAPWMIMDSRSGELNGEFADNVPDRFQTWGSSDFEIVFGDSSVAWSYINDICLTEKVPFAIYKYDPDGTVKRQFVAIYEDQVVGTEGTWDQGIASAFTSTSGYEEIYCYGKTEGEYQVADETAYIAANDIYSVPSSTGWGAPGNPVGYPYINRLIVAMYPEGTVGPPVAGTVIRFNTYKPLSIDDEFHFSTAGYESVNNDSLMQAAVDRINVYPNPYYGYDLITDEDFEEKVTFTHLPDFARIRIFNLAGVLVNTIDHYHTQFESWDLMNQSGIRVGSGMYIAHIDMPDIGREKILKFMIVRGGIY